MTTKERLKHVAQISTSNVDKKSSEDERPVRLCNYTDVYYNPRITASLDFMKASATVDQINRFALRAGDVLITKDSETADDIAVPALVPRELPGVVCGYHLAVVRPRPHRVDSVYLYWFLCSDLARQQFTVAATGVTRFGLRYEAIGDAVIPVPPLVEQRAIADYLDAETTRIDTLIARKRRIIELEHERYHSLVDHAFSEAGSLVPLKRVALVRYGLGQPPPLAVSGVAIIRATNIDRGRVNQEGLIYADLTDLPLDRAPLLQDGEILVVRSGALTGDSAIVTGSWVGCAPGYDLRVTPQSITPRFLAHQLLGNAARGQIDVVRTRAAQPHLNAEDLEQILVRSASSDVETEIVASLDREQTRIEAIADRLHRQIELLIEHRQALITAAVTGELDVSGAAA